MSTYQPSGSQSGLFARMYLILALLIVPAFGFYEGLVYLQANRHVVARDLASRKLLTVRNDLKLHSDNESLWVNSLTTQFTAANSPEDFDSAVRDFIDKLQSQAEYAIYDDKGGLKFANFATAAASSSEWRLSGFDLAKVMGLNDSFERDHAIDKLRPVLGRNFFIPLMGARKKRSAPRLFPTDLFFDKYRIWVAIKPGILVLVRVPTCELLSGQGLKHYIASVDKNLIGMAIFNNNELVRSEISARQARTAFYKAQNAPGKELIELDNFLYSLVQVRGDTWVLIQYRLLESQLKPGRLVIAFIMLVGFILMVLFRNGIGPRRVEDLSLLYQISLLLMISAGIPLAILGAVAFDYFNNKQSALIREKSQEMVEFIHGVDGGIQNEYARCAREADKIVAAELKRAPASPVPGEIFKNLIKRLKYVFMGMNVVRKCLHKKDEGKKQSGYEIFSANHGGVPAKTPDDESKNIEILAIQHMAALNSLPAPEVEADRAYLIEMVFQKPVSAVVHDLVKGDGRLVPSGWGSSRMLLFATAFTSLASDFYDFYLLAAFDEVAVQEDYILARIHALKRNQAGFKVFIAREKRLLSDNDGDLLHKPEVSELFLRVADYPLPEPEIVSFAGAAHLFVGLNGRKTDKLAYCILYPLEHIEKEISQEAMDLLCLAVLAVSLVVLMIVILYLNLLMPVNGLHQAAEALVSRNDSFRLSVSGKDEFAEMATIFNASIAEFEELKIANIVQTRLLPAKPLEVAGYSIFGCCMPMIELGGDYFDYFAVDDDNFALLLGDVAGHGVGASLIMAMAKAGVICGRDIHKEPAALLSRLHQIIFSIKNRAQRKVMTFQYLLVNRSSGSLKYANAGGCSPIIFDPVSGSIREISHPGAVLGGFKKSLFTNQILDISAGQAMVFYTDGLVEARNAAGIELGYQGFYDMVAANYDPDASRYFANILQAWRGWLGTAPAGDDITMIIMVREPS